jgi:hypothetical protein
MPSGPSSNPIYPHSKSEDVLGPKTALNTLDKQGKLDWSQAFLDGSFVPAKKGVRISPTAGKAKAAPYTWLLKVMDCHWLFW